ncbi:MAG: hypothetical protein V3T84_12790 [Phycisphaerales bacterium]
MLHCPLLLTCSPAPPLIFFCLPNLIVMFMFEKLDVYQKAIDFADRAASLTEQVVADTASYPINSTALLFQSLRT